MPYKKQTSLMGHVKCYKNVTTRLRRRQDPSANQARVCRPVQTGLVFFLGAKSIEPRVNDQKCAFAGSSDYYVKRKQAKTLSMKMAHFIHEDRSKAPCKGFSKG